MHGGDCINTDVPGRRLDVNTTIKRQDVFDFRILVIPICDSDIKSKLDGQLNEAMALALWHAGRPLSDGSES